MSRSNEVVCPTCNAGNAQRVHRNGFMQQNVLSYLGIYPWKCGECGTLFLFRRRGHRLRRSKTAPESGGGNYNSGNKDYNRNQPT